MTTAYSTDDRIQIYNLVLEICEIADAHKCSIYDIDHTCDQKSKLENFNFRFVQFRDSEIDGYITELTYEQQIIYALFCAEMVLSKDHPYHD